MIHCIDLSFAVDGIQIAKKVVYIEADNVLLATNKVREWAALKLQKVLDE